MSKVKRIGYQGIPGSNSLAAAKKMAVRLGWDDVEYVPLVTSKGVVDALKTGDTDYGVMAYNNHIAGTVVETEKALVDFPHTILAKDCIPIHHCLFVHDESVTVIDTVASHIQALKQCACSLERLYPDAKWQELEDTAIGARYLHEGVLPSTTGVLCRKDAGESFGLHLLLENLEDNPENATDFFLIEKGEQ